MTLNHPILSKTSQ